MHKVVHTSSRYNNTIMHVLILVERVRQRFYFFLHICERCLLACAETANFVIALLLSGTNVGGLALLALALIGLGARRCNNVTKAKMLTCGKEVVWWGRMRC